MQNSLTFKECVGEALGDIRGQDLDQFVLCGFSQSRLRRSFENTGPGTVVGEFVRGIVLDETATGTGRLRLPVIK